MRQKLESKDKEVKKSYIIFNSFEFIYQWNLLFNSEKSHQLFYKLYI